MKRKLLDGQLSLNLSTTRRNTPTWDDVHKGRARLVDRIEPCDRCYAFWQNGECVHTAKNFGFPKKRPNGMCLKHYIVWND